jgi:hypothetical protein
MTSLHYFTHPEKRFVENGDRPGCEESTPLKSKPCGCYAFCEAGIWTRALQLKIKCSTACATPPVHFAVVIFGDRVL